MIPESYYYQTSERLHTRPFVEEDMVTWMRFFEGNKNLAFLGFTEGGDKELNAKVWIDRQLRRQADGEFGHVAVCLIGSDEMIGVAGLIRRELHEGTFYELGYSFLPEHWYKGYAHEVCLEFLNFTKQMTAFKDLISIIHKDNIGSQKVAKKNGMELKFSTIFQSMPCDIYGVDL